MPDCNGPKIDYSFQLVIFFSKALKFYMHDVTVQPDRADTWAAMALARKSRLENKLNAVNYCLLLTLEVNAA